MKDKSSTEAEIKTTTPYTINVTVLIFISQIYISISLNKIIAYHKSFIIGCYNAFSRAKWVVIIVKEKLFRGLWTDIACARLANLFLSSTLQINTGSPFFLTCKK